MVRQIINIGNIANDGTGDTIRDAFDKCNNNFLSNVSGPNLIDKLGLKWLSRMCSCNTNIQRILCIGDSFTQGVGASIIPDTAWVDSIIRYLGNRSAGEGFTVIGKNYRFILDDSMKWWAGSMPNTPAFVAIPNWTGVNSQATAIVNGDTAYLYARHYSNSCEITWTVSDGSPGSTLITPNQPWSKINVPLPNSGQHEIVFTFVDSGKCLISGIESINSNTGILINNMGVGSSTPEWWRHTTDEYVSLFNPALSIIFLGLNNWANQLSLSSFRTAIEYLCNILKNYGTVALCTLPRWVGNVYPIDIIEYSKVVRDICYDNSYILIDLENIWSNDFTVNNALGLLNPIESYHPSDVGYNVIASAIAEMLFPKSVLDCLP